MQKLGRLKDVSCRLLTHRLLILNRWPVSSNLVEHGCSITTPCLASTAGSPVFVE
jgi:hypothetical protein